MLARTWILGWVQTHLSVGQVHCQAVSLPKPKHTPTTPRPHIEHRTASTVHVTSHAGSLLAQSNQVKSNGNFASNWSHWQALSSPAVVSGAP
jgi:hypothetical protein